MGVYFNIIVYIVLLYCTTQNGFSDAAPRVANTSTTPMLSYQNARERTKGENETSVLYKNRCIPRPRFEPYPNISTDNVMLGREYDYPAAETLTEIYRKKRQHWKMYGNGLSNIVLSNSDRLIIERNITLKIKKYSQMESKIKPSTSAQELSAMVVNSSVQSAPEKQVPEEIWIPRIWNRREIRKPKKWLHSKSLNRFKRNYFTNMWTNIPNSVPRNYYTLFGSINNTKSITQDITERTENLLKNNKKYFEIRKKYVRHSNSTVTKVPLSHNNKTDSVLILDTQSSLSPNTKFITETVEDVLQPDHTKINERVLGLELLAKKKKNNSESQEVSETILESNFTTYEEKELGLGSPEAFSNKTNLQQTFPTYGLNVPQVKEGHKNISKEGDKTEDDVDPEENKMLFSEYSEYTAKTVLLTGFEFSADNISILELNDPRMVFSYPKFSFESQVCPDEAMRNEVPLLLIATEAALVSSLRFLH